jgi:MFS family permease
MNALYWLQRFIQSAGKDVMHMEGSVRRKFSETTNYCWVIFVGCCALNFTVASMFAMLFGVWLVPMATTSGAGMVPAAAYATVNNVTIAVTVLLYGWLLAKLKGKQFNILLTVSAIFVSLCPLWNGLFALQFEGMVGFYVGAFLNGLSGSALPVMVPIIMISSWFGPKLRGKFIGFAASLSAIGAMIWPPFFTGLIQAYSLGFSFTINGVILAIFTIPFCIFVFRRRPDDVLPFGVKSLEELRVQESADVAKYGYPQKKAILAVAFWLIVLADLGVCFHATWTQNQPGAAAFWLTEVGSVEAANAAMIGAFMISMGALGNLIGKFTVGFIMDKWGAGIAGALFVGVSAIGMCIWLLLPITPIVLYAGALCLGMASPVMTVCIPMCIRQCFGDRTYPPIYSYLVTLQMIMSGFSSPLIAQVLVNSGGNYDVIYQIGIVIYFTMVVIFVIANRFRGKYPWYDVDGNKMPEVAQAAKAT